MLQEGNEAEVKSVEGIVIVYVIQLAAEVTIKMPREALIFKFR